MDAPDRPVRVLQALTTGEPGGTELMVARLVARLAGYGVQCEVSFLDSAGSMAERFRALGVATHDLSGGGAPGAFWRLIRLLRRGRFHIVHLYGFRMSLLGRVAARFVRPRPVVVHGIRGLHVTEGEEVERLWTRVAIALERFGSPLVDAYIANSRGAATFLSERGIPTKKFIVIPNGIDPSEWAGPRRLTTGLPTIVCVAHFRPGKRQADLIESVALLLQRGISVRCLLVGDGMRRPEMEALARRRGVERVVEFLGRQSPEEVRALLGSSDVFVLPSLWEGMPVSVMEAMSAGLPVVGTDVPGIRDLVVEGVTGYLVPARDPAGLAARLEPLLRDPALRMRMGEAGRARIVEEFSLEKMVEQHVRSYRRLLDRRSGAKAACATA